MSKCAWCGKEHSNFGSYCSPKCEHEHSGADPQAYQSNKSSDGIAGCIVLILIVVFVIWYLISGPK